jgi:hypothetical protein
VALGRAVHDVVGERGEHLDLLVRALREELIPLGLLVEVHVAEGGAEGGGEHAQLDAP